MKTAMHQLLDFIEKENPEYLWAWKEVHEKATELLETEKQQIIKAVLDGSYGNPIMTKEIATKYYNETFKP